MNQNQKLTITLIATTLALVGVLVGILAYFRKKAEEFDEHWGNSSNDYDDLDYDFDCCCGDHDHDHTHSHNHDFDESILIEEEEIKNY